MSPAAKVLIGRTLAEAAQLRARAEEAGSVVLFPHLTLGTHGLNSIPVTAPEINWALGEELQVGETGRLEART